MARIVLLETSLELYRFGLGVERGFHVRPSWFQLVSSHWLLALTRL